MSAKSVKLFLSSSLLLAATHGFAERGAIDLGIKGGFRGITGTSKADTSVEATGNAIESKAGVEVQLGTLPVSLNGGIGMSNFLCSTKDKALFNETAVNSAMSVNGEIGFTAWVPSHLMATGDLVVPFISASYSPLSYAKAEMKGITVDVPGLVKVSSPDHTISGTNNGFAVSAGAKFAVAQFSASKLAVTAEYNYSRSELVLKDKNASDTAAAKTTLSGHGALVGLNLSL